MTLPPSLNSNSNCSLASFLPTNSLVALNVARAGDGSYVFVNVGALVVTSALSVPPSALTSTVTSYEFSSNVIPGTLVSVFSLMT